MSKQQRTSKKSKNKPQQATSKTTKKPQQATLKLPDKAKQATSNSGNKPQKAAPKSGNKSRRTSPKSIFATLNRRSALKILAGVGITGLGVTSLHAYDKNQRTLHDLTVIGSGDPVIVQIHNPSCPTCRRLKSAVSTAIKSRPGIQFRLADITTPEGKSLQDKYDVPHVTLLFFNGEGKHLHTTRGLLTADQVRNNIDGYLS